MTRYRTPQALRVALTRWLSRNRSATASILSSSVIVSLVATVAIVSGGYTAQRVSLGDDAVWVANESRQSLGRANTAVLELNTAVTAASASIDVVQSGTTVLAINRGADTVDILDPATAEFVDSVALPTRDPAVFLSSERAVISANGDVWTLPRTELADFDSASAPELSLGAGSVLSLDAGGSAFSFTPTTGSLVEFATHDGNRVLSTVNLDAGTGDDEYQLSSVAGVPVLLNETTGVLIVHGNRVDLSALLAGDAALQAPSPNGDTALIAHRGGLISVGLSGAGPTVLVEDRAGAPAAPTQANGCDYTAWADGGTWQRCAGGSGTLTTLDGLQGGSRLAFQVNGATIVLNDLANGSVWAVQRGDALIDNWNDLIDVVPDSEQISESTDDIPEFEDAQVAPVAVDDAFGARPGLSVTLPVLLNDYDANGDALVIDDFTPLTAQTGRLDLISNNQQLQLTLAQNATGVLNFAYSISDGRGGTASATVTVAVVTDSQNSAPEQVRSTSAQVETGDRVTTQVLGDWVDPDGDPIYLTGASTASPDTVTFTPDGAVTFTHGGGSSATPGGEGSATVGLSVSDGTLSGSGTLQIQVNPIGSMPIVADTFVVLASAGTEVTVAPLDHVRGGSGTLRLTHVSASAKFSVIPDFVAGTFRFQSDVTGTHYLEYTVAGDTATGTGRVRVQVSAVSDVAGVPVTVPHTAFLRGTEPALVDVLSTDIDPGGGVLLVTGTSGVPAESGLRVEILDQNLLRLTLTRPLERPVTFSYTVSNGLASAPGTVTVIELPALARLQAPLAEPDSASVRVGEVIDIPVLANDRHPDGVPVTLAADLTADLEPGAGLLFTSGSVLRYLAPAIPGNFTAVYRVEAPDGQFADAEVRITVREADAAANRAPAPATVTTRVLAGATVRIPIPLSGIDPDGDTVQLLGQNSNPEKGSVAEVGPDWIDFTAGEYATGTDRFSYTVVDALGARATGLVRVGISPRLDGARNPIAVPDVVTVRPGRTVTVRVLSNDSDPDNGPLTLGSVEPTDTDTDGVARIDGRVIIVDAPRAEGRTGFLYTISSERGGTASSFLTVIVDAEAPYQRPEAADAVLTLSDILDRSTVDVDVLSQIFFADGAVTDLTVQIPPDHAGNARVLAGGRIRVTVTETSQIIPFSVIHPSDPSIIAYAFIRLPGSNDALPQRRTSVAPLTVPSEAALTVDINDYVVAIGDTPVRLTGSGAVQATHANGSNLVVTDRRLVYTSAAGYFGPASLSFEVTDARQADDPDARTATIVLPILVTPRENQPPVFDGAVLEFEPDQSTTIDLHRLTAYPYPDALDELVYTVLDPQPVGFDYTLRGSTLVVHAAQDTPKGSRSAMTIGVRDVRSEGTAGRMELGVVASSKPLAVPADDVVQAFRGTTTVVDVLANDGATNPFPAVPLRVVAVRGLDGAGLPRGVSITPNTSQNRLSIVVAADAEPANTSVQYQVADATGDPDRYAWATVRVSVADVPDPVAGVSLTDFGDKRLTVSFRAGPANNSALTGFDVVLTAADSGRVVGSSACAATRCTVPTAGNGSANAVRVSVTARNAVGSSAATTLAGAVWSDVIPAAPGSVTVAPLDRALRVAWNPVPASAGSAVREYVVTLNGQIRTTVPASACTDAACSVVVDGLTNGQTGTITVSARNDAFLALTSWNHSAGTGTPYGMPVAGGVTASASNAVGWVTVAWDGFDARGRALDGYVVQRLRGAEPPTGAQACTVSSPAPGDVTLPSTGGVVAEQKTAPGDARAMVFEGLTADNGSHSFVVWGYNAAGCVATAVTTVLLREVPGPVTAVQGAMQNRVSGEELTTTAAHDYHLTGATATGPVSHYQVRSGGVVTKLPAGGLWPRELDVATGYGSVASFDVQACNADGGWAACGEWSSFTAPEASVDFTVRGLVYDTATGEFSWTNGPDNGRELQTGYTCRVGDTPKTSAQSPTTCRVTEPVDPNAAAHLTVTVNGQSFTFTTTD